VASHPRSPDRGERDSTSSSSSSRKVRAWRYDEGYGAPRYRRRRRSGPLASLQRGAVGELLSLLTFLPRRHPLVFAALLGSGLWLIWPSIQYSRISRSSLPSDAPRVITTFIEDPQRIITSLDVWKSQPGSILVLQGNDVANRVLNRFVRDRNIRDLDSGRVVSLTEGCDTFGQLTTLQRYLKKQTRSGLLTVVTSQDHLDRSVSIARDVIGSAGWKVEGVAADTGDNRPEHPIRRWRDHVRFHVWRLTGWDGTTDGTACRIRGGELG
jgi:hypothetical protein